MRSTYQRAYFTKPLVSRRNLRDTKSGETIPGQMSRMFIGCEGWEAVNVSAPSRAVLQLDLMLSQVPKAIPRTPQEEYMRCEET
eukprot:scaffold2420_cov259-Pinguiococcus_pyrenoidosus.AAC.16